ncbi:MAG: phage portal protein [Pseudomonadota bacterium]|nr:phage portal protein [Pseudomonadota bacterium]
MGRVEPSLDKREFKMASQARVKKSWSGRTSVGDANQTIYRDHETLRQRAREQSINSGYAKRFYRLLRQNVIGPRGIQLMSKATNADGTADVKTRRMVERSFKQWAKRGNCDVTGQYDFVTFLWLWVETMARDGEVMVRIVRNWSNRWGFAVQILEADRLDTTLNTWLDNGNRVRMGVEIDEWERPVAYWLKYDHPGDAYRTPGVPAYQRILASECRLTFDPWRPHQSRGFTWTHAGAADLHHIDEYSSAELVAAEKGSKITGIYQQNAEFLDPPDPEDPENDDQGVIVEHLEAGDSPLLPYGIEFVPYDNKHPSTNFAPFNKAAARRIAAAFGPSYNRLAHDLEGVSFSSLRSGELDERDFYQCAQQFAIAQLLEWVGDEWLRSSVLHGAVAIAPRHYHRLAELTWLPRGWDWVDPKKDSEAAKLSLETFTDSVSDIARRKGRDPDELFEQIAEDRKRFAAAGLADPYGKTTTKEAGNARPDDTDDDGDEANAAGTD